MQPTTWGVGLIRPDSLVALGESRRVVRLSASLGIAFAAVFLTAWVALIALTLGGSSRPGVLIAICATPTPSVFDLLRSGIRGTARQLTE